MAVMPRGRMGSPLRSFAVDAHGCIMVWRDLSRPQAGSPPIIIRTISSVPSCSKLSRYGLERTELADRLA